jgi:2,5-diamino-6-(ribosylamino)-4(3H)-pyrimidinone 5'-phosphate reductase
MPAKKPYVICHMMTSLDGRIKPDIWNFEKASDIFEETAKEIKVDAWLVGRTTMQLFSSAQKPSKKKPAAPLPRTDFVAKQDRKTFAVAIDPHGKCNWDTDHTDTEHVIEVLTESVSDAYLESLRSVGVSYIFGGKKTLNLARVLDKLRELFGIKRVRIDGGGTVNGAFLGAGLIDEISLLFAPLIDGTTGSTSVFDISASQKNRSAIKARLTSVKQMPQGILWLRYKVRR